ncbi:MAG: ABC transporter ATP-binding protein/permease [Erysipelotrichaceae bacterium]|nr:ABC transporter ATP-binding protein/permease [Erysipelotrichaceae bacterium]
MNDKQEYTGLNKILKSQFVQTILDKIDDGTFSTFIEDWQWIFTFSRKYRRTILFYLILGLFSSTLGTISSVVSKYLIDIIVNRDTGSLGILIVAMIGSTVFSLTFSSVVSRLSTKISIYVNNDIQASIFDKIIDAEWLDINKYQYGDLLNRFNSDVSTIASNAVSWIPTVIIDIYSLITSFVVILYYDVTMAFIAFLSAPFLLLMSRYVMRRMSEYRKKVMEMNSKMMSFEIETFYNFDSIKSFGITSHYSKELRKWQEKYKKYNLDYNMFSIKTNILTSIISTGVGLVAFGYCLFRLWTGSITYGTMTLFLNQRSTLSSNFNSLVSVIPGMLNSSVSAHRIKELVDLPKEVHDPESLKEIMKEAYDGITVELKDVNFAYDGTNKVIEESNFIAKPNEIVAVVGPSGEGKTTMLRIMLGLVHPQEGKTVLYNKDGKPFDMNADLRQLFSYVPQGNTIIAGSVADNLRMVKEDATDEEIIEALKIACAWPFVEKLENGIDEKIGEKGKGFSEGQAQRIAIARAVLRDAPVLLLDEATSALDTDLEKEVLHNIIKQRPNKTCIVSTHRPSVLSMCQRIYRVKEGHITELQRNEINNLVEDLKDE